MALMINLPLLLTITISILCINTIQCISAPSSISYSPTLSKKYAVYAGVAFCPRTCVQQWSCTGASLYPKLINVTYVQNSITKAVGYIGYDASTQTIVISWRGSDNTRNWIQDFTFQMEEYAGCQGCYIHSGFYMDYKLNQKRILAQAQAIIRFYRVSKILCTGHSLGAALTFINALEFSIKFPNIPVQVHNFGSPRVGNHKLISYVQSKISQITRVVHNKDIVPHLPPEVDYRHPAYQVLLNEECTSFRVCDGSGEDPTCSNGFFPNYTPDDHDFYYVSISGLNC